MDDQTKEFKIMLLNSSGTAKGGVAWLAAGIIVVFLAVIWLFSGRGPWAPEAPDKILAKTVIQKKVMQIPQSLEREAVQKAAVIPLKPPVSTEVPQAPAPVIEAKPPDPIMAEQPVEEEPAAEEPIVTAKQPVESQVAAEEQPPAEEPPATQKPPVVEKQPVMAATAPETVPKPKTETPPAAKPAPVKEPIAQKPVVAMTKPAAREIHREKWLLSQDASSYTIQILGVSTEKSMLKFIERNQLLKENDIAYYESVLRGKPWFQALYGIYPTKEEARRAIKKLPENIRRAGPWIRKLAAVQKTIVQ